MRWPAWFRPKCRGKASISPTQCPDCGREMVQIEKFTMTGNDLRTFRCERCKKEHIVDFGVALWKAMSDPNKLND